MHVSKCFVWNADVVSQEEGGHTFFEHIFSLRGTEMVDGLHSTFTGRVLDSGLALSWTSF